MKWPVNVVIVKWSKHIVSFLGRGGYHRRDIFKLDTGTKSAWVQLPSVVPFTVYEFLHFYFYFLLRCCLLCDVNRNRNVAWAVLEMGGSKRDVSCILETGQVHTPLRSVMRTERQGEAGRGRLSWAVSWTGISSRLLPEPSFTCARVFTGPNSRVRVPRVSTSGLERRVPELIKV